MCVLTTAAVLPICDRDFLAFLDGDPIPERQIVQADRRYRDLGAKTCTLISMLMRIMSLIYRETVSVSIASAPRARLTSRVERTATTHRRTVRASFESVQRENSTGRINLDRASRRLSAQRQLARARCRGRKCDRATFLPRNLDAHSR